MTAGRRHRRLGHQALAGGYPALLRAARAQDGVAAGARYLVAAP